MIGGGGGGGDGETWCTVVAVDTNSSFTYRACANCERPLSDNTNSCLQCSRTTFSPGATRLFRILISIATVDQVFVVVFFDRAARVLFGCSADELFSFCQHYTDAAEKIGELLKGEMLLVTLSKPKNGNAQHLRVAQVTPVRSGFTPVMEELKMLFEERN